MAEDFEELLRPPQAGQCTDLILEAGARIYSVIEAISFAHGRSPLVDALEIVRDTLKRAIDAYEWGDER